MKIKLTEILSAGIDFKQNPTEENQSKLAELINGLTIIQYRSLAEKNLSVGLILNEINYDDQGDASAAALTLEMAKIIYGLLPYAINLENDLAGVAVQVGICDDLYRLGVVDAILKYCAHDYALLETMINNATNFSNIYRLVAMADVLTSENLESFSNTIKDLAYELTPEKMDFLKKMVTVGSPEWKAIQETVTEKAIGQALEKDLTTLGVKVDTHKEDNELEEIDENKSK